MKITVNIFTTSFSLLGNSVRVKDESKKILTKSFCIVEDNNNLNIKIN